MFWKLAQCIKFSLKFVGVKPSSSLMNRKESSSPATSSLTTSRLHLRDLIIDTAMSMFKQRGIKSVTMDELSSRMGISKRTLYELFEDKETLLVSGMRKKKEQESVQFDAPEMQSKTILDLALIFYKQVVDDNRNISRQFYDDLVKYPKALALIDEFHQSDMMRRRAFFMRGVEEGMFRSDINYDVLDVMPLLNAKPFGVFETFKSVGFDQAFQTLMMILLRGIATAEGQEKIDEFLRVHGEL